MTDRNEALCALAGAGYSRTELAGWVGISRERVRQIVGNLGERGRMSQIDPMPIMRTVRRGNHETLAGIARDAGVPTSSVHWTIEWLGKGPAIRRLFRARYRRRLLIALRMEAQRRGRIPSAFERGRCHPMLGSYQREFGSWNNAIRCAGMVPRSKGRPRVRADDLV